MKIFSNFRDSETDSYLSFITQKYKDKPVTFWYDKFPENASQLSINPYNILFLHEPNEFFGLSTYAIQYQNVYTAILSWDQNLLDSCPNGVKFTYNGCTLDLDYIEQIKDKEKQFKTSFLCGTKDLVEGHKLRHKVFTLKDQLVTPNNWYYVLEDFDHANNVRPGYSEYGKDLSHIPLGVDVIGYGRRVLFEQCMFNVVIENVNHLNWYNKIGDNFLTKTIPIYWGCSNISEFGYDERGIIRFNDEKELLNIINNLTPQVYNDMKPYIDYNYEVAKLDFFENNISKFFDEFFHLNNI